MPKGASKSVPRGALSRLAAVLVAAAAVAGCEGVLSERPETSADSAAAASAEAINAEASGPADEAGPSGAVIETGAAPPTGAAPADGAVAALTPEPAPEPAPEPVKAPEPRIDDDPQQLYGLDSGALDTLLGKPSLVRTEAPAEIWQYRSQTCVFDIFLYGGADRPRVTYIEARDDAARRIDARGCLNELLRARMGLGPLG